MRARYIINPVHFLFLLKENCFKYLNAVNAHKHKNVAICDWRKVFKV